MKSKVFFLIIVLMSTLIIYGCSTNPTGGGGGSSNTGYSTCTLTVSITPEGKGTVVANPAGNVYFTGTTVVLTATPIAGYSFDYWSGDLSGDTSPANILMIGNKNVLTHFRPILPNTYPLTVAVTPSGAGTIEPWGGNYTDGTSVTLTADAYSGYTFSSWEGSLNGITSETVTMTINGTKDVTATFKHLYPLTVSVSPNGAGTVEPWGGSYVEGSTVTLTADAYSGYSFSSWEGDLNGNTSNPVTMTMNGTKDVIATFKHFYPLTVSVSPSGAGTVEPWGGSYVEGSTVTLTADAYSGYSFSSWEGDLNGNTSNPVTMTMNGTKDVTATFDHVYHGLNISVSPAGAGTVEPWGGSYVEGSTVTLTADAYSGYSFSSWEGDLNGNTSNPVTITMNGTKDVTAIFIHFYPLTVSVSPSGAGTVEPWGGNYVDGTNVTLTAEANAGCAFDQWSGDLSGSTNPVTITMNGTKNITAQFVETWQVVGNAGFSAGVAGCSTSLFIYGGTPYVAYIDCANGNKATVMKYNGSNWVNVGNAGFSAGVDEGMPLSIFIYGGIPYVAFRDANHLKETVMKYNGSNWVNVGNAGFSAGTVYGTSLFVYGGTPYVAYGDSEDDGKAIVMKFNGSNWVNVGNAGFSAGVAGSTSLFINGDGTPYVAYCDQANSSKATVMKFNGSNWENVGSAGFSAGAAGSPSLFISGDGTPYVAYSDGEDDGKATVKEFNGSSWENVGYFGFSSGEADLLSLFIYSGTPYVAYIDCANGNKATVMKFNGSNWENVGSAGFSAGAAGPPSLFIYSGIPYVAYEDVANSYKATVMKYGP